MDTTDAPPPQGSPLRLGIEQVLTPIATALAVIGGVVLMMVGILTVYSIIGRALPDGIPLLGWWEPVRGNFELVELGTAIGIFSFLPYTHLKRGNVLVDFFTLKASPRAKAALAVFANLLYSGIVLLFTWRMAVGTGEIMTASYTQTTMLLRIPIWYGYLPTTLFMVFLSVVALYSVWRSLEEALGPGEPRKA
ncbi:MAG TPA: TRAP transporter small permease [Trueperaceae bacterium]|nr:TRAP transporter small permease [Trueperaceae bacterium]